MSEAAQKTTGDAVTLRMRERRFRCEGCSSEQERITDKLSMLHVYFGPTLASLFQEVLL
jgi:hypothetical protein